jgi:hypothetical protein
MHRLLKQILGALFVEPFMFRFQRHLFTGSSRIRRAQCFLARSSLCYSFSMILIDSRLFALVMVRTVI